MRCVEGKGRPRIAWFGERHAACQQLTGVLPTNVGAGRVRIRPACRVRQRSPAYGFCRTRMTGTKAVTQASRWPASSASRRDPSPSSIVRPSSEGSPHSVNGSPSNVGRTARNAKLASVASGRSRCARSTSSVAISGPCTTGWIALLLRHVAAVVVDAVTVEGQRRIAEQHHGVGRDRARPRLACRRRDRLRRRRPRLQRIAIDDVVLFLDAQRAVTLDPVLHRHEASRPLRPVLSSMFSIVDSRRAALYVAAHGKSGGRRPHAAGGGTGGRKPPRFGWPSGPTSASGATGRK